MKNILEILADAWNETYSPDGGYEECLKEAKNYQITKEEIAAIENGAVVIVSDYNFYIEDEEI